MLSLGVNKVKKFIVSSFRTLGYKIESLSSISNTKKDWQILNLRRVSMELLGISPLTREISVNQAELIGMAAKSQLGQDILALSVNGLFDKGFFVEFGATNGVNLSNTYLLEKDFGWGGILCEPARVWHRELKINRSCSIDTRCVSSRSNSLINFSEAPDAMYSTISDFLDQDHHVNTRAKSLVYQVETVSLRDLLVSHNAPETVNFLSIDTEGSEYLILEDFNFTEYKFKLICVEHNYSMNREKIFQLLTGNGYKRVLTELSQWDDWYVDVENPNYQASQELSKTATS